MGLSRTTCSIEVVALVLLEIDLNEFLFRKYGVLVVMFFLVSVVNNYALNFNIPMPLHMIFRSVTIPNLSKESIKSFSGFINR